MKLKKIIFSLAAPALCLTANAQDAYSGLSTFSADRFAIGFKIAPAISWISPGSDDTSRDGTTMKFNWGFVAKYHITENFGLVTGFNVNGLGGNLVYQNEDMLFTSENKFTAFEIPIAFRLTTEPMFQDFFFYAQVGLGLNYAFNPRLTYFATPEEMLPDISERKSVNRIVIGYNVAVGAEYQFTEKMALTAQVLYNSSLSGLLNSSKYRVDGHRIMGNYNFVEFGLGVMFY